MHKVNILGEEWEIKQEENDCTINRSGYCDWTSKEIVVINCIKDKNSLNDLKKFMDSTLRHEIIHAFLFESGLTSCSNWATNEEMIDFFAMQWEKINKVIEESKNVVE